jgi:hypothetical protein
MMARDEILRRFMKWSEGHPADETFTMQNIADDFEEIFPEIDDGEEAVAILKLIHGALTTPPRKPVSRREISRRFNRFIASKPVGAQFTIEEIAAAVFPDLDEAAAREEAYAIATNLGWEGAPWLQKAR